MTSTLGEARSTALDEEFVVGRRRYRLDWLRLTEKKLEEREKGDKEKKKGGK